MRVSRAQLDAALPTIVRYVGLILTVALTVALALGHTEVSPGFVPATGLLLYKTVKDAVQGDGDE